MPLNPWDVLGVEKTATRSQVKSAYYRLARIHHPDLNPDGTGSADMMRCIVVAAKRMLHFVRVAESKQQTHRWKKGETTGKVDREAAAANALLYEGWGRPRGISLAPRYRITMSSVEIHWPVRRCDTAKGVTGRKDLWFRDVRRVVGRVELQHKRSDLELELFWGPSVELQSLPDEVADEVERLVGICRQAVLKQRERMLRYSVSSVSHNHKSRGRGRARGSSRGSTSEGDYQRADDTHNPFANW